MTSYTYLNHKQLKLHPDNIRRFYPDDDVSEMAASIKANGGVIQALLITPAGDGGHYYVVDGNMRLAGARRLGDECPPLKCEIIEADHARQMLIMAVTSERHYPKDPISKALHYRRLIDEEGLAVAEVAQVVGCSSGAIYTSLKLLDLDPDIQELVASGRLPSEQRVARSLLAIPDPAQRIALARRFASRGTSISRIQAACRHVARQNHHLNGTAPLKVRKPANNGTNGNGNGHHSGQELERGKIYDIASKTLCDGCRLDGLGEECYLCPGPYEFIEHMVELAEAEHVQA